VATITQSHDLAAGPTPPSHRGGAERPADWAKLDRNQRTRLVDIWKKKQNRKETRALLQTLAELEAKERGISGPVHSRDAKLHTVMERLTRRLKLIAAKPPPEPKEAALSRDVVVAGMVGGRSLGTLYVCVEDWVVRSSNRAMELMCPYELLRGYVGLELTGVVHPDDHLQLALLQQEQVHSFQPGDTLVLSVRMLRACTDGGTLVVAWRRQFLEVANIARDEEHGGKLHVLFTCVLDKDSLEPLTFNASDRWRFQVTASAVSGSMAMDPHRTTASMDTLCNMIGDAGIKEKNVASSVTDFLYRLSGLVGRTLAIPQLLSYLQRGARLTLNGIVRSHLLLGLDPDGVPCYQKSSALCAFGLMSKYHTYVCIKMSGAGFRVRIPGLDVPSFHYGVFKHEDCPDAHEDEGGDAVGLLGVAIVSVEGPGGEQRRRIVMLANGTWSWNPETQVGIEVSWLTFYPKKKVGALPKKHVVQSRRTGPPDPEMLKTFLMFERDGSGVGNPFPEFS